MEKRINKRDWEIAQIFLILAVLTAGFVWAIQSLILTPGATGHNPGYMTTHPTPLNRGLDKDAVRADVLGKPSDDEYLFSPIKRLPLRFQSSSSKDKQRSFEEEDSRIPRGLQK